MKYLFIISFAFLMNSCKGQTNKREFYNKQFNWKIEIPEGFEKVSSKESKINEKRGTEALEKTYGGKIPNQATTIFEFVNNETNYFDSNYQPFDTISDGNYLESCKNVNEILYNTFKTQLQDVQIDSATSTETIDSLVFQKYVIKISLPNNMTLSMLTYSRLFDKKEFSCNIMYIDKALGELILNAWRNSKFGKK